MFDPFETYSELEREMQSAIASRKAEDVIRYLTNLNGQAPTVEDVNKFMQRHKIETLH